MHAGYHAAAARRHGGCGRERVGGGGSTSPACYALGQDVNVVRQEPVLCGCSSAQSIAQSDVRRRELVKVMLVDIGVDIRVTKIVCRENRCARRRDRRGAECRIPVLRVGGRGGGFRQKFQLLNIFVSF